MITNMKCFLLQHAIYWFLVIGNLSGQELTPAQKAGAKELIRQNPETIEQVRYGARPEDPLTPEQIEKVRRILRENPDLLKKDGAGHPSAEQALSSCKKPSIDTVEEEPASAVEESEPSEKKASMNRKISAIVYGRTLFAQDYRSLSRPDVPENYTIVPGDQILLRLWGRYNLEKIYTIGDDGYVFIDPLNKQIYLKGTTHREFKRMIQNTVNAMAGVEGEAKVIATHPVKIRIAGQAIHPGTILIPPYFTFWQALMTSRGPSNTGSVRDIRLVRGSQTLYRLDIYMFLKTGKIPDLAMKDGDLIFFGEIGSTVEIRGLVKREGLYEMNKSETLKDLIDHAGNIRAKDYSPIIQVERIIPIEERTESGPTRKIIDIRISDHNWKFFRLQDGDVFSEKPVVSSFENQVHISGAGVKVPGRYSMPKRSYSLWELIQKAGGLIQGYSPNMEVVRQIEEGTKSIHLKADNPVTLKNFVLNPYDSILTYHQTEFRDSTLITVRGFVRDTISFRYSNELTLENVLQRSGGLRDGALDYVYIKKTDDFGNIRYEKVPLTDASDYLLKRRDEVFTFNLRDFNRQFPVSVLMDGKPPLTLEYTDDLNLEIIIHRLGGLLPTTDSSHIEINTPDFSSPDNYVTQKYISLNRTNLKETTLIVPGMLILIRNDPKKRSLRFVTLKGEFQKPGRYTLKDNRESLHSVITKAGGLTRRANAYSMQIKRSDRATLIPVEVKSADPLILKNEWMLAGDDVVLILRNDNIVEVAGAVFNPAIVPFDEGYSWRDYVQKGGGGALDTADIKRTYIIYPNGYSKKGKRGFRNSRVVPGSKIVVPMKPYEPPKAKNEFKYSEFIANLASTVTVFATVFTTYILVTRK